ncbi:hypothetical protein BDA96_05G159400 [Sorghum bicolor]|uniref:Uncharacterized protein n=1 Tax=Sorghum bicolor TaxID=4558 RepID=A0A921UHI9_SORBI|nr:hypothetical protein BDA96_05G159400 [Sorghum bicolor]
MVNCSPPLLPPLATIIAYLITLHVSSTAYCLPSVDLIAHHPFGWYRHTSSSPSL